MAGNGTKRPTKEDADQVWVDIAEGISKDDLLAAAPDGWTPTDAMMAYAVAYVSARPLATIGEISKTAGIDRTTVAKWRHGQHFRAWMSSVLLTTAGVATAHVWRACHWKASQGDAGCIRMWVRRFDPVYATRIADSEGKRPDAAAIPEGTAKGAQDALNSP